MGRTSPHIIAILVGDVAIAVRFPGALPGPRREGKYHLLHFLLIGLLEFSLDDHLYLLVITLPI